MENTLRKENYEKTTEKILVKDCVVGEVYYRLKGNSPFEFLGRNGSSSYSYESRYLDNTWTGTDVKTSLHKAKYIGPQTEEIKMSNTLYKIKDKELYGIYLTNDNQGRMVLEMKGSGDIAAYKKDELEEVTPYTVGVQLFGETRQQHFETDADTVNQFDVVYVESHNTFGIVKTVDTKKKGMSRLQGYVIPTKEIN